MISLPSITEKENIGFFLCVALTFKDKKVKDEEGSQIPCFPNILHMLMFLTTYCMTTYTQR